MIRDAYRFLIPLVLLAAVFCVYIPWLVLIPILLAAFVAYFFRNPARTIPDGENLIVSPADGRVVKIATVASSGNDPAVTAVSIFLNIFNVHVTRSPIAGTLSRLEYVRGAFKAAYDDAASGMNEQNVLTIQGNGIRVVVKQIAGLIARRVICWKSQGEPLERGELFGLIRFGSRVDLLVPASVRIVVKVGDSVKGGSSIIGEIHG